MRQKINLIDRRLVDHSDGCLSEFVDERRSWRRETGELVIVNLAEVREVWTLVLEMGFGRGRRRRGKGRFCRGDVGDTMRGVWLRWGP